MFESNKPRYLTRGVNELILPELRIFMWTMIDNMQEPKDYLQVFNLYVVDGVQIVKQFFGIAGVRNDVRLSQN